MNKTFAPKAKFTSIYFPLQRLLMHIVQSTHYTILWIWGIFQVKLLKTGLSGLKNIISHNNIDLGTVHSLMLFILLPSQTSRKNRNKATEQKIVICNFILSNYRYPNILQVLPMDKQKHNYNNWRRSIHQFNSSALANITSKEDFSRALSENPGVLFYKTKCAGYDTYFKIEPQMSKRFVVFLDSEFLDDIRSTSTMKSDVKFVITTLYVEEDVVGPSYMEKLLTFFLRVETTDSDQVIY